MSNNQSIDQVTAKTPGGEPELVCQAILDNRMQCANKAYAKVDDIDYCRLHLNILASQANTRGFDLKVVPLDPENQKDIDTIMKHPE